MVYEIVVEIIPNKSQRLVYLEDLTKPVIKEYKHRFMDNKAFIGFYGYIKGFGTPPSKHSDAIVLTSESQNLGDIRECKLIGAFKRSDNDHKFLFVLKNNKTNDICDLTKASLNKLFSLYDNGRYINKDEAHDGESWLNKIAAEKLLSNT
ncbi:hypothetical protein CI105_04475 [Candidatus Izimaplasma bacterium ZiA1]|uniref:inorganic diphosphatase n=1 Tax=Candidatus Izimoplasma sp. ZiA1 TaxID=2024899 RepID=UPI000BAA3A82|nr:hypothetical protein CI105_04475 [Candidatus Izimaplasma bacterium ZiA1]